MILRKTGWALEYLALRLLAAAAAPLPARALPRIACLLARFIFDVLRIRRGVVLDNLSHAFPEMDEAELLDLARRTYVQICLTLLEFFRLPRLTPAELRERVELVNAEEALAMRDSGRGALLATGHFGNWEYLGAAMNAYGFPTSFLIKTQSNPWVDRVQNEIRAKGGMGVIRQQQVRRLMEVLRAGEYIGILPDQNAGGSGVFIDFFGRKASAARGLAYLARRYRCPIVPMVMVRRGDGRFQAVFGETIHPDPERDEESVIRELTQEFASVLENFIRANPDHYFWVHRRWKTRPPGEGDS